MTNGPAFSLDGRTMYHTDSALQRVYAFDLAEDGSASGRRVFLQFGEGDGYPDGMTVDAENCLWIAFWDGWCVRRFSPSGERLAELRVPGAAPDQLRVRRDRNSTGSTSPAPAATLPAANWRRSRRPAGSS